MVESEKYIYVISWARGQESPQIYSIWDSYEKAILEYYNSLNSDGFHKHDEQEYYFLYLHKIPLNVSLSEIELKLNKSSKYRVKFKNWGEIKKEYARVKRDINIEKLIN